jgi:hypothetical protein
MFTSSGFHLPKYENVNTNPNSILYPESLVPGQHWPPISQLEPYFQKGRSNTSLEQTQEKPHVDASFKYKDQVVLLASRNLKGEKVFEDLNTSLKCWEMGILTVR